MIQIKLKNIKSEFLKLYKKQDSIFKNDLKNKVTLLVEDLKNNTPVDTGFARDGWFFKSSGKNTVVENDVPYINSLNEGHSKQAPAYFVEKVALKHGKPLGTIVINK